MFKVPSPSAQPVLGWFAAGVVDLVQAVALRQQPNGAACLPARQQPFLLLSRRHSLVRMLHERYCGATTPTAVELTHSMSPGNPLSLVYCLASVAPTLLAAGCHTSGSRSTKQKGASSPGSTLTYTLRTSSNATAARSPLSLQL